MFCLPKMNRQLLIKKLSSLKQLSNLGRPKNLDLNSVVISGLGANELQFSEEKSFMNNLKTYLKSYQFLSRCFFARVKPKAWKWKHVRLSAIRKLNQNKEIILQSWFWSHVDEVTTHYNVIFSLFSIYQKDVLLYIKLNRYKPTSQIWKFFLQTPPILVVNTCSKSTMKKFMDVAWDISKPITDNYYR